MAIQRKMINIRTDRPIKINGDMYGPITTNYLETLHNIWIMVFYGVPVTEILKDGSEVELTLENYDKDNGPVVDGGDNNTPENGGDTGEGTTPPEVENPEVPVAISKQVQQKRPEQPKVAKQKTEVK